MSKAQIDISENGDARYQSYLLRVWQEGPGEEKRALLQDVLSGESRSFPSLESLFAHLGRSQEQPEGKGVAYRPAARAGTILDSDRKGGKL